MRGLLVAFFIRVNQIVEQSFSLTFFSMICEIFLLIR